MRVLVVHDQSLGTPRGGERHVVERELAMLAALDVTTELLEWPPLPPNPSPLRKAAIQVCAVYSPAAARRTREAIASFAPDVVHVHNLFPLATPAILYAARKACIPVVFTLHNYRIVCATDVLLREGKACDLCVEPRLPIPAIRHRCVRGSTLRSAVRAVQFGAHRIADTWNRTVDRFLAPTESVRRVFVRAGIDADRILIRPQSAPDVGIGSDDRDYFLFAGRLSPEKGVEMLLAAWEDGIEADLLVAGGGVLEGRVREAARRCPRIRYLGELTPAAVGDAMRGAVATLLPSLWEEPFPLVIAESYSAGTPVIAADSGTRKQTVPHGETGLVFAAGDAGGLKAAVRWAIANPAACRRLGHEARKRYESFYSEDAAGRQLLDIYRRLRHDTGRVATRATT